MIRELWKDTLSAQDRGKPLVQPDELDEVSCLMVAERIDLKRFTGNLIALLTQGVYLSSLSPMPFAQSQSFTPTPSMEALVPPFLRPRGLPMWFMAGFPDVANWMNNHLDHCSTASDEESDYKIASLMGIQGLPDTADLQSEIENSQGHLRVRYCRNLIENYKREAK